MSKFNISSLANVASIPYQVRDPAHPTLFLNLVGFMYKDNKTFMKRIFALIKANTSTIDELVEEAEKLLDKEIE